MDFFDSLHNASLFVCFAVQKAAAARRNGLLLQAFCRHLIQHEGAPAPSYSPCKIDPSSFKPEFFDKLKRDRNVPLFRRGDFLFSGICGMIYSMREIMESWCFLRNGTPNIGASC